MAETQLAESNSDTDNARLTCARRVIEECFWGDYQLSAEVVLSRLDRGDPGFDRFIFSKIIENSRKPSWYLPLLFQPETLQSLLTRYIKSAGNRKRVRLIAANLTGRHDFVPELQWQK
jgi:hypothetical protein